MANLAATAVFYQEVIDAIARNPPDVGDLIVLRDLCIAVAAADKSAASPLAGQLSGLDGPEDPLRGISGELFQTLFARILMHGWFAEFDRLMDWQQTWFGSKETRLASKWEGIVETVTPKPSSASLDEKTKEWEGLLNALEGAFRHLATVRLPPPPTIGAPPEGPSFRERVLPERITDAIEHFFRLLQTLFQQLLESAVRSLERDSDDVQALWKLAKLQDTLRERLNRIKLPEERRRRGLDRRIRVAEVRYGRAPKYDHRFLDAFPRYDARSVVFNAVDREDKDQPFIRGELPSSILKSRDLQLRFYFDTYGQPVNPKDDASPWHIRRRTLIKSKHNRQLTLKGDDDFVKFLVNYFDDELADVMRRNTSLSKEEAAVPAWLATVNPWSLHSAQFTSHSRLNLTEGPPNYLTHAFPRNIAGRLFHDCGVYAVRAAYTLLTLLEWIGRAHSGVVGTVRARWVRLPLHVGLFIESDLGVVLQHNQHLDVLDTNGVDDVAEEWLAKAGSDTDTDPADTDEQLLKFHEDLSASAFSSDLDMPISSTPVLAAGEPVTTRTIWNSYQKKVVPSQLFSSLIGAPNAPQYQFDLRYLKLSELEREWYNEHVRKFWNVACKGAWDERKKILTDPAVNKRPEELKKHKEAYTSALQSAVDTVLESYKTEIKPKKEQLNLELRADKKLLLPKIRIVAAARIGTVLPAVRKVNDHIKDVSDPDSTFPPDFVPTFAKPEEELLEIP